MLYISEDEIYNMFFCVYEKEDKRAMDLALITAKQVFELFILILCGVVIGKIKMVNEEGKGMLSNLLIYFVVPFMIINSYMSGYNAEILKNMGRMLFYSILTICIGMALSIGITFLMKKEVRGIIRFATTFSNAAYMGFPLIQAMYGSEGVLYASVYVTVFNILLWTVGIVYVSESMSFKELLKKIVTCPPIISVAVGLVIFLARIPVADVLKDTFNVVGGMNTPLSMIITGITISQFPLLSILKDKRVSIQYNNRDTLSTLIKNICKAFNINNDQSCPKEIRTIASSLISCSTAIEDLRSTKTEMHGKTKDDFIINDSLCAYFVVNAVSTIGLFLLNYYRNKYPAQARYVSTEIDPDDLPF